MKLQLEMLIGTLQVGKELTANTNNLDLDGLNNVSYNYQWSHVMVQ